MSTTVTPFRLALVWLAIISYLVLITGLGLSGTTYTVAKGLTQAPIPVNSCSSKTILFVGGSRPLPLHDQPLAAYLTTLGHTVIVLAAHEVKMPDVKNKDLVIISESVESEDIKKNLRHVDVPIYIVFKTNDIFLFAIKIHFSVLGLRRLETTRVVYIRSYYP